MKAHLVKLIPVTILALFIAGFFVGCGGGDKEETITPPEVTDPFAGLVFPPTAVSPAGFNFDLGSAALDNAKIEQLLSDNMSLIAVADSYTVPLFSLISGLTAKSGLNPKADAVDQINKALQNFFANPIFQERQLKYGFLPVLRKIGIPLPLATGQAPIFSASTHSDVISCGSGSGSITVPDALDETIESFNLDISAEQANQWAREGLVAEIDFASCNIGPLAEDGPDIIIDGKMEVGVKVSGGGDDPFNSLFFANCGNFSVAGIDNPISCDGSLAFKNTTTTNAALDPNGLQYDMAFNAENMSIASNEGTFGVHGSIAMLLTGEEDPDMVLEVCNFFTSNSPDCAQYVDFAGVLGPYPSLKDIELTIVIDATFTDRGKINNLLEAIRIGYDAAMGGGSVAYAMYPNGDKDNGYYLVELDNRDILLDVTFIGINGSVDLTGKYNSSLIPPYYGFGECTEEELEELDEKDLVCMRWPDQEEWVTTLF